MKVTGSLLLVVSLQVLLTLGRREAMGVGIPNVLQSIASLSSSSAMQVGMLSNFFGSVEEHYFKQVCA